MIEHGINACRAWALEFDQANNRCRDPEWLAHTRAADAAAANGRMRYAMAQLPFDVFVTTLIHYSEPGTVPEKLRVIREVIGVVYARRQYWNLLDRAHHFAAGLELGVAQPDRHVDTQTAEQLQCG